MNAPIELLKKNLRIMGLLNTACLCGETLTEADKKEAKETIQTLKNMIDTYENKGEVL